jgi:hypothetical protein
MRNRFFGVVCILLLWGTSIARAELRAGVAKVDITPKTHEPLWLIGFMENSAYMGSITAERSLLLTEEEQSGGKCSQESERLTLAVACRSPIVGQFRIDCSDPYFNHTFVSRANR